MLPLDQQLQYDVAARLQSDPTLSVIGIVRECDGVTDSDAALALGPARGGGIQGAQAGSLIVVQQTTDGADVTPNVPGPREGFRLTVRVLELPKLAQAQPGYLSYFAASRQIKALLHLCQLGTAPIVYVRGVPYNDGQGTVGKDLLFSWVPAPEFVQMVAQPTFQAGALSTTVLQCSTPGATIYATTDGSYPVPTGTQYVPGGGIATPAAGQLLRAVAYAAGMIPSGVTEQQF